MAIPAGYTPTPFGGWVKLDGSGPYFVDLGGPAQDYVQLPSGWWVKEDGSGPYRYDPATRVATPATDFFKAAT